MSELYDQPNDQAGQSMRIESRIVPPVTSNSVANGRVRFLAPTSGLLLEDSYIRLQVKTADNNQVSVGIGAKGYQITYDAAGRRQTVQSRSNTERYHYDSNGNLSQIDINGARRFKQYADITGRVSETWEYNGSNQVKHEQMRFD